MQTIPTFLAIDFETANRDPRSACELAVAKVVGGVIQTVSVARMRPPEVARSFGEGGSVFLSEFTKIHGIKEDDVTNGPPFAEVWETMFLPLFVDVEFVVAHNAKFDRGVLNASLEHFTLSPMAKPWRCTLDAARQRWGYKVWNRLPDVCARLGIEFGKHHEAAHDAIKAAEIALRLFFNHTPAPQLPSCDPDDRGKVQQSHPASYEGNL